MEVQTCTPLHIVRGAPQIATQVLRNGYLMGGIGLRIVRLDLQHRKAPMPGVGSASAQRVLDHMAESAD
jgi:hypothetical protein